MKIKELLGESWFSQLYPYIGSNDFKSSIRAINKDRKKHTVIPEKGSDLFFKAFRETSYENTKVIILGQDPYSNPENAFDGLAFSNSFLLKPQSSLDNILKEVEDDIYDGFNPERRANLSLYNWTKQGVLLINAAHTVIKNRPESHLKYWLNFTIEVINTLDRKRDLVWLLMGRKAQAFEKYISNPSHYIIKTAHPSPLGCMKNSPIPFIGSKCFNKINEELEGRNLKKIIW